jgi:REP element-mobilizing transposase RayT
MKQLSLIKAPAPVHGGELQKGKRKTLRPLSSTRPIHLILKAKERFKSNDGAIVLSEAKRIAQTFQLQILDHAVANDHLHLAVKIPGRREYDAFARTLAGLLARKFGKGIFRTIPYTRVAHWGKDYKNLEKYLEKNRLEAAGELPYKDRFYKEDDLFFS